ncbi:uncharacterized protein LOC133178295 [Saccostrea echinata]|uniref:uncharacterized protein LOC133178295 n=1 Tax=Saccostrea echinata TaxID=191078 RepID=UPI002A83EEB5|nr:uncharacterized protein LOC133178295 [Saccostrea echinata]
MRCDLCETAVGIASDVEKSLSLLQKEYEKLSTAITKQGEIWQREISELVNKLKSKTEEMKNKQLETLQKHFHEIKQKISDIQDEINSIDVALNSTNISIAFGILPTVDKYRKLPKKITFVVPRFSPNKIQEDQVYNFNPGILEEHEYKLMTKSESPEAGFSPPVKQLLDEPETVTTIVTGYRYLYSMACLSDEEIWTSGTDNTMKLHSINQGTLLKSIKTKSRNRPEDIAVTKSGDLVYTDTSNRTVNIVKNEEIEEVIRLKKWRPDCICSTSAGDLFVTMFGKNKQSKVVRYSGSTEKQTIQFDETGKPLFSFDDYNNFISENRNMDICVVDSGAREVVVVNQAGKLRFRYPGYTPTLKNQTFTPQGITTDSQSHILTADAYNNCVHIIDQDGQFLRYIQDCGMRSPVGLCTDTNDNLYIAEQFRKDVKKNQISEVNTQFPTLQKIRVSGILRHGPPYQCLGRDTCLVNLCKACIEEHILTGESKDHKVVKFKDMKSTIIFPECKSHAVEKCEMCCNQCDIPDIASDVERRLSILHKEYENLSTAITKQGEILQREIKELVNKLKSKFDEMKNKDQSHQKRDPLKQLLDEPETVTTMDTGYGYLYNVACLSDKEIWTSGSESSVNLHSINQGSLLKSITTISGTLPEDMSVTKSGDLVYTDINDRTVKNEKIEKDICVSASGANAVVVVNQAGKLRFRYTGHTSAPKNKLFNPLGITTDSQSHILTADSYNDCVHVMDQDGQFLCYIECGLSQAWGLCTDTNDNLYVTQQIKNEVKKIKYQK